MSQIVYITNRIRGSGVGGREQLSLLNGHILHSLVGSGFERIELDGTSGPSKLFGYVDGVSRSSIVLVCNRIKASGAKQVFLDGSNLGRLAEGIRKSIPGVEILTFFHNCEARFFLGALRQRPTARALGILLANYMAERAAVLFSDQRICLNDRDSRLLLRLYCRGATFISPMAIHDRSPLKSIDSSLVPREPYALFVGGTFYANRHGIEWYVDHVAAQAPIMTNIVGKGFECWKDRLERNGNVNVVGAVDDLAPWYLGAQFVVAPIFDGSGMKTKVAEALMFGKRIVGTPEAFVGYESVGEDIGAVCATATEFIAALESETSGAPPRVDPRLRALYEQHYSYQAARSRLAAILGGH